MTTPKKRCNACQHLLDPSAFHAKGKGLQAYCKSCQREYDRERKRIYRATPEGREEVQQQNKLYGVIQKRERREDGKWRRGKTMSMIQEIQAKGWSQHEIAEKLETSQATVSYWALGKRVPTANSLHKVWSLWRVVCN